MTQQLGRHTRQHHKLRAALQNRPERMKSSTSAASVCVAAAVLASAQAFVGPSFLQRPSASGSEVSRPHSCAQPVSPITSTVACKVWVHARAARVSGRVGKEEAVHEICTGLCLNVGHCSRYSSSLLHLPSADLSCASTPMCCETRTHEILGLFGAPAAADGYNAPQPGLVPWMG